MAENNGAIAAEWTANLQKVLSDARYYEVTFDDTGNSKQEDVEKAVQTVIMIRVQLC